MRGLRGIALGLVIAGIVGGSLYSYFGANVLPQDIDLDQTGPRLVTLSIIAFVFLASLIFGQPRIRDIVQGTIFWGGLFVLLIVGYTFRSDLINGGYRVLGALAPGLAVPQDNGTILVVRGASGHFRLDTLLNGTKTQMLLDTGASSVVLTYQDALNAGLDPANLLFTVPVQTANGSALVAPVRIKTLSVSNFRLTNVRAFVSRDGALGTSLLGMSALDRLSSWRIEGDKLVLVP
ncbi:retropepsin-like aspartic protease family protein [Roseibium algae]|uniref:TIGR02281 family clan AA aspartic protease n=1 Tax=Roseibium algae TaxID=3123038 RepID=A0ABU8TIV2_9HYPH